MMKSPTVMISGASNNLQALNGYGRENQFALNTSSAFMASQDTGGIFLPIVMQNKHNEKGGMCKTKSRTGEMSCTLI